MNTWSIFKTLTRKQQAHLCLLMLWRFIRPILDPTAELRAAISRRDRYTDRTYELLRVKLAKNGSYFKRPPLRVKVMVPLWALLGGGDLRIVDTTRQRDKLKAAGFRVDTSAGSSRIVFPDGGVAYEPLPRKLQKPTDDSARTFRPFGFEKE